VLLRSNILLVCAAFAACVSPDLHRFAPDGSEAEARAYLALVRRGQLDSALVRLHPALSGPDTRSQTAVVQRLLSEQQPPDSADLVGAESNRNLTTGVATSNLTFQLQREGQWMLANVAFLDSAGRRFVIGLNANPIPTSLQELNAFSLSGRSGMHYVTFALAAIGVIVCLAAAIYAGRQARSRRWLWVIIALIGVGRLSLNWTDGAWFVQPIGFQLLGGGFIHAGPYAAWIVTASLPIGALISYLIVRRQNRSAQASAT
jgi:hypothetical protein